MSIGVKSMENILLKEILKTALIVISPLIVLALFFFHEQPEIALAVSIGVILGILRLKVFFNYITNVLNRKKSKKDVLALIKYLASLIFTFGTAALVIAKSISIGLALLFGLITVPIIVTFYSMLKGLSLYRKR